MNELDPQQSARRVTAPPPTTPDIAFVVAVLARWKWLVLIAALTGGVAGFALSKSRPDRYEAQDLIVAEKAWSRDADTTAALANAGAAFATARTQESSLNQEQRLANAAFALLSTDYDRSSLSLVTRGASLRVLVPAVVPPRPVAHETQLLGMMGMLAPLFLEFSRREEPTKVVV